MVKSLKEYRRKRNFKNTPEPSGKKAGSENIFVVQKHDARKIHYDFRLEVGGILKSWAVPKGPSLDPSEKRLAVPVEDHPVDYADFEGVIPEGQYGAGTVMIWDKGTYENMSKKDDRNISMQEALNRGRLEFFLKGKKLKGAYALIRTGMGKTKKNWLLIKKKDSHADVRRNPVNSEPDSAVSGRSLGEIKSQHNP